MFVSFRSFFQNIWVKTALVIGSLGWQFYVLTAGIVSGNHFSDEPIYVKAGWSYVTGRFD
jgi:hypothetical protein